MLIKTSVKIRVQKILWPKPLSVIPNRYWYMRLKYIYYLLSKEIKFYKGIISNQYLYQECVKWVPIGKKLEWKKEFKEMDKKQKQNIFIKYNTNYIII